MKLRAKRRDRSYDKAAPFRMTLHTPRQGDQYNVVTQFTTRRG